MKHFEQLLEQNQARLRRIARSYAESFDYEDILQEIFLQLWRAREGFRGDAAPATWVFRVALNTAMSYARRRRSEHGKVSAARLAGTPQGQTEPDEQARLLEDFLGSLNDSNRAVLLMYLEGLDYTDIADVLGCQPRAATTRLSRLKTLYEQRYLGDH